MNLGGKPKDEPDVNLTPLIDVVFLLLIFFMVSTTFKKDTEIKVDLPEASAEPIKKNRKVFEIIIDARGRYFVNKKELVSNKIKTMKQVLLKNMGKDSKKPLIIRADYKAPHGSVVMVMDAARQLGIVKLSIATSQPKEEK
ncbi:MAG TPA: biopolymer transporter ExbD [Gammaproteobacteria bacterium]|nr:biopolymer transporter ExbD [Gammaproteobacteria bacterium]